MSKVSHLPKNVPSKELPFKIKVKGSVSGHSYTGDFVVRVPGVRAMGQIGVELARLNDGIPLEHLDKNTARLHNSLAYLKVALIKGPKWFVNTLDDAEEEGMDYGLDTDDINVPIEIFRKADKMVQDWYESLNGQPKDQPNDEVKD